MQLYMSWYIRSFFGFTFLNILYFFKYSCTNIFHRRSLYTLYGMMNNQWHNPRRLWEDEPHPGPWFNIKTAFPRYGDSHVKDKTVARHGDPYTGKTTSLYWDGPLGLMVERLNIFRTNGLLVCWHYFHVHFLVYNLFYFNQNFKETYFQVPIQQLFSIFSYAGLAMNKQQASICINDDLIKWVLCA